MTYWFLAALAAASAQAQGPPALRASMISLGVTDMRRAAEFYGGTLGLEQAGPTDEVTVFQAGDVRIALNRPLGRAAGNAIVGATEVVFQVESVTEAHAALAARGCSFLTATREIFSGTWAATFTDPDGHKLTLMGPR
jgi:predicted enzyme related to lactoylglutathione lyase